MDALRVRQILLGVPCLKATGDDDLIRYLAGVTADVEPQNAGDLADALGPFLESQGCCEDEAGVASVCAGIFATLISTGLVKPPLPTAVVKPRGGYAELEENDAAPPSRALAAPVKLGASAADSASLDILWGRDKNKFLQQNTDIDREAQFARCVREAHDDCVIRHPPCYAIAAQSARSAMRARRPTRQPTSAPSPLRLPPPRPPRRAPPASQPLGL